MFCCPECFNSPTLVSIVQDLSEKTGECEICNSKNVEIVNIDELAPNFFPLLNIYQVEENSLDANSLLHEINEKWKVFKGKAKANSYSFLNELINSLDDGYLFTLLNAKKVGFKFINDNEFEKEWEILKREIKEKNRYFFKTFKPNELEEILNKNELIYHKETLFYRARLSDKPEGIPFNKMRKPPKEKAKAGRVNPLGIPYLYLALEPETVLHEVKAYHYDYVTIATFEAIEDLTILSLATPGLYSPNPFMEDGDLKKTLSAISFLDTLEEELAKPIRRNDSELEYLPTQYICELAKNLGFDGIEYKSTLYQDGTNIAVFNDDKMKINSTKVVEIKNIIINSKEVS
jgi:hypothetical protein